MQQSLDLSSDGRLFLDIFDKTAVKLQLSQNRYLTNFQKACMDEYILYINKYINKMHIHTHRGMCMQTHKDTPFMSYTTLSFLPRLTLRGYSLGARRRSLLRQRSIRVKRPVFPVAWASAYTTSYYKVY